MGIFLVALKEEILSTDKLEYREDENGIERFIVLGMMNWWDYRG